MDAARLLERYSPHALLPLLERTHPAVAAGVLERLAPGLGAQCLTELAPERRETLTGALPTNARVRLLQALGPESRAELLASLPEDLSVPLERLMNRVQGTAGELVDPDAVTLQDDLTVRQALRRVQGPGGGVRFHVYVADRGQRLVGMVTLSELIRARNAELLREVMHRAPPCFTLDTPRYDVVESPLWEEYTSVAVVDAGHLLLGVVGADAVARLWRESAGSAASQPALDAVLALGELYWTGLVDVLQGVAVRPGPPPEGRRRRGR